MTTRKTQYTEERATTHSKVEMAETRFMEEQTMISFRATAIGTLFMEGTGMTRLTAIEEPIGSGETKEMISCAALVPALEQTMAAAESREAREMTPLLGPAKEILCMVDLAMIHCVARLMLTNYLATLATISSMAANHTITSLVGLAPISITLKNRTKRMSTKTPFISAMDIQSAIPQKVLFHQTHSKREAHSHSLMGLILQFTALGLPATSSGDATEMVQEQAFSSRMPMP
ncbi:hypothetical protein KR100_15560 [Synechococcus sp. KORDI-100]|nr:hypothetical protein KR100_15560 [Synechococcus sp. KORDI-100]